MFIGEKLQLVSETKTEYF